MRIQAIFLSLCLLLACKKNTVQSNMITIPDVPSTSLSFLALGDSYTIGEAVSQRESFPFQLVSQLKNTGLDFSASPKIIAKTGWTTSELQAAIKADNTVKTYELVTLLIGVNNQYRGNSIDTYRKEFKELLQTAINFAGGNKKHVFVVSIPDWGVTPFAKQSGRDPKVIAQEIDSFNAVNKEETQAMGITYTDITPASRNASTDPALIANDGLHPSGKMYADWANALTPKISSAFKQ